MHAPFMTRNIFSTIFLVLAIHTASFSQTSELCTAEKRINLDASKVGILVIEENWHGTQELPKFTAGVICALVKSGKPVLLGLEMASDQQENINIFLDSNGTEEDRHRLLSSNYWRLEHQDGRASEAVFELIEQVRLLRHSGQRVAIALLDMSESDIPLPLYPDEDRWKKIWPGHRQKVLALNAEIRAAQYSDHAFVVLTGHASKTKGRPGNPSYESMTYLLSKAINVRAIGFTTNGGNAWMCRGPSSTELTCKGYPVPPMQAPAWSTVDEIVEIGPISMSPPATSIQ